MINKKVTFKYFLAIFVAVIFTWLIHEFAHWLTAKLLGYESIMKLNGTFYADGENPTERHKILVSAAGPIVTILQGLVVFLFLKYRDWNKYLYPVLFIAFYMRFLAGLMNFANLNDEGRIGQFLGIGNFTLSILVSGLLFYMVYSISKNYNLNWKFQALTTLFVIVTSSFLILSDMFFGIRIL
jgi:hypothetical protein